MSSLLHTTPQQDGFHMPGEWESHAGCWMLWPERPDTFRQNAWPAQQAFAEVASAISQFEPLTMGVSARQFQAARGLLPAHVRLVELSSNDAWMRDVGPTFVNNGQEARAVDWEFNAWGGLNGGLYFPWDLDNLVARKVAELERVDWYHAPLVLEGGSIAVDGEGTLITTEECLLNPNRNPQLSRLDIESHLRAYLNLQKIIWLPHGCPFDETSGHVDNLCAFLRPGVVALTWTDDKSDPQYEVSRQAYDLLMEAQDAQGRRLEVHKIHQPNPVILTCEESAGLIPQAGSQLRPAGARLAASYVNFYLPNGGVVVPQFGDERHDRAALQTLQALLPERKIVGITSAREIALGGGNVHCITQQQPKAKSR